MALLMVETYRAHSAKRLTPESGQEQPRTRCSVSTAAAVGNWVAPVCPFKTTRTHPEATVAYLTYPERPAAARPDESLNTNSLQPMPPPQVFSFSSKKPRS